MCGNYDDTLDATNPASFLEYCVDGDDISGYMMDDTNDNYIYTSQAHAVFAKMQFIVRVDPESKSWFTKAYTGVLEMANTDNQTMMCEKDNAGLGVLKMLVSNVQYMNQQPIDHRFLPQFMACKCNDAYTNINTNFILAAN